MAIDEWPFWMLEENIKIVNEITEEEEKKNKSNSEESKASNFNPNSYVKSMENMANKFKP